MSSSYIDVSMTRKSPVWNHFLFNPSTSKALCKTCSSIIKVNGSNGMIGHLKTKHSIKVNDPKPQPTEIIKYLHNPDIFGKYCF